MIQTVDLVVTGDDESAAGAALGVLRGGGHVLVVLRSGDRRRARRLRRYLLGTARAGSCQLRVLAGAEVVCVDGVNSVEAVVIRHSRTGRLSAVNASGFVACEGSPPSSGGVFPKDKEPRLA